MTPLDVLIGLVAIAIGLSVLASVCFLGVTIFYYFYNKKKITKKTTE